VSGLQIKWKFNMEIAPWWGVFFERMVQLLKRCLRKLIGQSKLTYEELSTSITEAELIINSRPLTYINADDLDEPLTPSHLIYGRRLMSLPDHFSYSESEDYNPDGSTVLLTKRLMHLNRLLEHFWNRWRREYLVELRECHRRLYKSSSDVISVGDVVIIHDDSPRGFWKLGLVERLIEGRDNEVRGAVVRVKSGQGASSFLKRPIQRLYPLEVCHSESDRTKPEDKDVTAEPSAEETRLGEPADESSTPDGIERDIPPNQNGRPKRRAALEARDRIMARLMT
jgi:hypothetical protein